MFQRIYDFTWNMKINNKFCWRLVYKVNRFLVGLVYPIVHYNSKNKGIDEKNLDVILSLTSYPARIKKVWITIESLLHQTVKPGKIILWLDLNQFPNKEKDLPKKLLKLQSRGLQIEFCGALRSHKKYFYAMQKYPDSNIIIFDDDMIYPPNQVEKLWNKHLEYPDTVCCHYGHAIELNEKGEILPYKNWVRGDKGFEKPTFTLMPVGCNGVLYPPNSLDRRAFQEDKIKELCINADDIWLKIMSLLNDVKAVSCNYGAMLCFGVLNQQKEALYKRNTGKNEVSNNDIALQNVLKVFPEATQKLMLKD